MVDRYAPRMNSRWWLLWMLVPLTGCLAVPRSGGSSGTELQLRRQERDGAGNWKTVTRTASWDPRRTAVIVCDMWDDHWCKSASARVGELVDPMNQFLAEARSRGMLVIHAPSSVTGFYDGTPARQLARQAPFAATPVPLAKAERWGTQWCWPDPTRESVLPIDDSDMGCSCSGTKCTVREAWKRQHAGIVIQSGDALTDDGQETWNLLAQRGVDHVILCGVHLNMCVLGRPFAIRQMVRLGKDVALARDLTDTMYNPERPPGVDHFTGTDLVVSHVERHWCPSFVSSDLTGGKAFRFAGDPRR